MPKTVKLAHFVTLSSSPVPCSCKNLSFLTVLGFFDWPMVVPFFFFFFFKRKVVQLAGKPFEGLTVDRFAQRTVGSHCRTQEKPTLQESLESLLIGKNELFRDENCSVLSRARARMSIKYIAWLRSAQPFLFPDSSKLSSRFFISFRRVKKNKKEDELEFDSCVGCVKWCACLVWIDFCHLANAQ